MDSGAPDASVASAAVTWVPNVVTVKTHALYQEVLILHAIASMKRQAMSAAKVRVCQAVRAHSIQYAAWYRELC